MGMSLSCSREEIDGYEESFGSLFTRSLSFVQNAQSALRSFSFNGRESEPAILGAFGSGKLFVEGSLSFNGRKSEPFQLESKITMKSHDAEDVKSSKPEAQRISRFSPLRNMSNDSQQNEAGTSSSGDNVPTIVRKTARFAHIKKRSMEEVAVDDDSPKHEAAVKLQKVYRSFRTRRQLADCAVLIEQRWWKLLDFALLKRSSISFFEIEREESAVSKWSRAKSRAAKVGKGLSKDEKAQKLALQHWLEAIDPRHRYGHNLNFYYDCWLQCESKQPFFYWLDVGEGKEVNLLDQCPRSKLQHQCIKYLGPKERESYEVIVEDGKFMYKHNRQVLNTVDGDKDDKWIFVLSTSRTLYVGQKKKGKFQHSSFLAGGATSAAGRLVIENGILKAVWPHSGHYRPTQSNFEEFISFLQENNVDVSAVQTSPVDDEEELSNILKSSSSQVNMSNGSEVVNSEKDSQTDCSTATIDTNSLEESELGEQRREEKLHHEKPKLKFLEIPALDIERTERRIMEDKPTNSIQDEEDEEAFVPQEKILKRINSKKGLKSYQLGKQLSCKWTTGAGPRIGCVRDYPTELQFRTLEDVHLSPRSAGPSRFSTASPRPKLQDATTPKEFQRDTDTCFKKENCIM